MKITHRLAGALAAAVTIGTMLAAGAIPAHSGTLVASGTFHRDR